MTPQEAKTRLEQAHLVIKTEKPLPNNMGTQLRLENGAIVNIYNNGNYNVQGKNCDSAKAALGIPAPSLSDREQPRIPNAEYTNNNVFVVYGHDSAAKTELEAMLRRWELNPIILDQIPSEGSTLIEKLEKYFKQVGFGIVLATPDDEAYPKGKTDEKKFRARQNVVLELGLLLAHLGRKRVVILLKDQETMERPSDIQGLVYIPFKSELAKESGLLLAKEMTAQGYKIDIQKI
jgi:predicted nucleotide-binding protein